MEYGVTIYHFHIYPYNYLSAGYIEDHRQPVLFYYSSF